MNYEKFIMGCERYGFTKYDSHGDVEKEGYWMMNALHKDGTRRAFTWHIDDENKIEIGYYDRFDTHYTIDAIGQTWCSLISMHRAEADCWRNGETAPYDWREWFPAQKSTVLAEHFIQEMELCDT